jgi:altronate hydrolase
MKQVVLKIHPKDNVLVALKTWQKEKQISFEGEEYILHDAIGAKHKFFTHDCKPG